jgi:hypothetical protein
MKILILGGAGMMGSGTVRDLVSAQSAGVEKVIVADTTVERARSACQAAGNDRRLEPVALDVTDGAGLRRRSASPISALTACRLRWPPDGTSRPPDGGPGLDWRRARHLHRETEGLHAGSLPLPAHWHGR